MMKLSCIAILLVPILFGPTYVEAKANNMAQFGLDSLILAISSLSSDEFANLPGATRSLVQNSGFLALRILDVERGTTSNQMLAKIIALRLDAALAEEYNCVLLRRGKSVVPIMKKYKANLKELTESCEKDAHRLNVDPASVCAEQSSIIRRTDALLKTLEKGIKCK